MKYFNHYNYINIFIFYDTCGIDDIYHYINRYNTVEMEVIKSNLKSLIKDKILVYNKTYQLTNEGKVILNDNIYYYSIIIYKFLKRNIKIRKKYQLKEIRQEQQKLRNYLINKEHSCILCDKHLPLCLLETAHLKPRCILNYHEMHDVNIVEFMCRYCHTLYDNGYLSVHNGMLQISDVIKPYELYTPKEVSYNSHNEKYFLFHYKFIYKS